MLLAVAPAWIMNGTTVRILCSMLVIGGGLSKEKTVYNRKSVPGRTLFLIKTSLFDK
jgi:hypothetical protein